MEKKHVRLFSLLLLLALVIAFYAVIPHFDLMGGSFSDLDVGESVEDDVFYDEFGNHVFVMDGARYTFLYPFNWVVDSREFVIVNGTSRMSLVLRQDVCDNPTNWVYVNRDDVDCDVATCVVVGGNVIASYSEDVEFYSVFEDVAGSFRVV